MTDEAERAPVRVQVIRLMSRVFGKPADEITEATGPAQIERWDSLSMLTVLLGVEQSLNVAIPSAALDAMHCVGDLVDAICAARRRII